mmetsp:Transcript_30129/g.48589  ORF Transcript_30129/g.48589 Transcript_30129/m.48589 type:complete len:256 (-) Transcript_30129:70-837(-)|eukprot:CAMPEP_0169114864 /NCGR_PEP_ID=MMETSP1015-20121227/29006_1 /TAXON_ID=342587 /ORGANISM="Karlodinium micrum, Strain CCMP2283" /LENGTH=255 /DNA_ID=CAMNT_0009177217 /DNA_START=57 /DNA_END=824 /DNA_ORIENTATION=+
MSLKHVVHKRVHKERHQPAARQHLGYLEKKKDYVKRARDFHRKEDAIKKLHQKAYFKNPDEFAFGMVSMKNDKGRVSKKKENLSEDELKLLDSQDARYIGMREQIDKKAIEKQARQLHFLDAPVSGRHTVFVDEDEDAAPASSSTSGTQKPRKKRKLEDFDVAAHFDTRPELLGRRSNRLRTSQLETGNFAEPSQASAQGYRELLSRQERLKRLTRVREELDLRAHLRTKGKRKKVTDGGKDKVAVYKWFPERKR